MAKQKYLFYRMWTNGSSGRSKSSARSVHPTPTHAEHFVLTSTTKLLPGDELFRLGVTPELYCKAVEWLDGRTGRFLRGFQLDWSQAGPFMETVYARTWCVGDKNVTVFHLTQAQMHDYVHHDPEGEARAVPNSAARVLVTSLGKKKISAKIQGRLGIALRSIRPYQV